MDKTVVVKRYNIRQKIVLNDKSAPYVFTTGHCHSFALAVNKLTGWPIYGVCDKTNKVNDPGHCVNRNPKTGGYLDVKGYGAIRRWRKNWGPLTIHPLTAEQAKKLYSYVGPNVSAALPFAKKLLKQIGVIR